MKLPVLALTTVAIALNLAAPAAAQRVNLPRNYIIRNESQDFFRQGWQQFEREIQFLILRDYFFRADLLKIQELPPLEDGPFSLERSDAFTGCDRPSNATRRLQLRRS